MARYPIGKQNFKSLREGGYIYVDKTQYIPQLLEGSTYYFLARPRRFGKSLFLSTLEYFFLGQRSLFKDLAVESYPWSWELHPVIHIDLNGEDYTKDIFSLQNALSRQLSEIAMRYGVNPAEGSVSIQFRSLIQELFDKYGKQVVVLIDEYEKPVLDNIDNQEMAEYHKATLRGFYGVLKSLDEYLKLVFITGVTKFGKMSVFSELNNLRDISLRIPYSAICGVTEQELRNVFKEGIERLAEAEETDFEGAVQLLKQNYDGYHFSEKCPDLYNPYSLINALEDSRIGMYWASTGTPNILATLLVRKKYNLEELDGINVSDMRLMDIRGEFDDPVSLFYQTGYLTIKASSNHGKIYTLGFPNKEVEGAFSKYLVSFYLKSRFIDTSSISDDFISGILSGDIYLALKAFTSFSSSINYELIPEPEVERHFQNMVYMFSRILLPYTTYVKTEDRTSDGRIDMTIMTVDFIYIFEIKRDSTAEDAMCQIEKKGYSLQYTTDPRKVFLIGMNFSTKKRRLDGYIVKELDAK